MSTFVHLECKNFYHFNGKQQNTDVQGEIQLKMSDSLVSLIINSWYVCFSNIMQSFILSTVLAYTPNNEQSQHIQRRSNAYGSSAPAHVELPKPEYVAPIHNAEPEHHVEPEHKNEPEPKVEPEHKAEPAHHVEPEPEHKSEPTSEPKVEPVSEAEQIRAPEASQTGELSVDEEYVTPTSVDAYTSPTESGYASSSGKLLISTAVVGALFFQ